MAIERMTKVVEKAVQDYSWDRIELWHADGMGIHVSGRDMRRVTAHLDKGAVYLPGAVATYELVDGRWELARFEPKGESK